MKVLFYRYNSICEPDFIDAFKKIGLEVAEITEEMYRKNIPGEERVRILLEGISENDPLFVFSIDFFPFISMVCERLGVVYAALSVDCPVAEIYSAEIRNRCNRIFLFDKKQYESVRSFNPDNIRYMPLGAATERLEQLPYPETYRYGISFIGSLYNEKDRYGELKKSGALSGPAFEHMESLISEQTMVSGMDVIENGLTAEDINALKAADPSFYTSGDSVIDMDRYVAVNNYLGNHLTCLDRIRVLNMLAGSLPEGSVHLFTRSDTSGLDKRVKVHGGVDTLREMPEVFRASKINLNLTSRTIRCGLPQRIWDIAGCRAFCLTDAVSAMDGLLDAGTDIMTFSSYEELPDLCMHYLDRDDEREEIAQNGFNKVAASHTVLLRALEMVKIILSEKLAAN
ncbi:MAG: glycosyltransferase [Lachnospiraceae bacterium]|nr:glycosyltransferase [Lachnospiraceae bacterium]